MSLYLKQNERMIFIFKWETEYMEDDQITIEL